MNNEQTLLALGFTRHPEWDYTDIGTEHYRLEKGGRTFRAYVVTCNGPVYVIAGEVINEKGIVKRWKDCCSVDSVRRFIA